MERFTTLFGNHNLLFLICLPVILVAGLPLSGFPQENADTISFPSPVQPCREFPESRHGTNKPSPLISCITAEKKAYYQEGAPESARLEAAFRLISLYHQAYLNSNRKSDRKKEAYWKKIYADLSVKRSSSSPDAEGNAIAGLRSSIQGQRLRIVLDMKKRAAYEIHENREEQAMTVDFTNTSVPSAPEKRTYLLKKRGIRADLVPKGMAAELVLADMPYESFRVSQLPDPPRWVVDIRLSGNTPFTGTPRDRDPAVPSPKKTLEDIPAPSQGIHKIIIDPGHGGKDPGAVGLSGYSEKDAVLDIGLRLKALLLKQLKVDVLMTRTNDVFIPLEQRTKMANEANADLFISIHANSSPHRTTRGIEIYLLGQSSDRRALRTAARENNVSEAEATNMDKNLVSIKNDLTLEFKREESLELAHTARSSFLDRLRPAYPVVDLGVKTAPFYVLMNTSMPSILAEVSFISNPQEELRLKNKSYRQIMAESLLEGIRKYIAANSRSTSF